MVCQMHRSRREHGSPAFLTFSPLTPNAHIHSQASPGRSRAMCPARPPATPPRYETGYGSCTSDPLAMHGVRSILDDEPAADGEERALLQHKSPAASYAAKPQAIRVLSLRARRKHRCASKIRSRTFVKRDRPLPRQVQSASVVANSSDRRLDLRRIDRRRLISCQPSSTARSVPCPIPVNASDPYNSTCTRATCSSWHRVRAPAQNGTPRASDPWCANSMDPRRFCTDRTDSSSRRRL